jgi:D-inositol-3-phosphate glycosyltransferase
MLSVHSCPLGKLGEENTGGMSVYVRELARELGRRGHRVDVFTRAHEPMHERMVTLGPNARLIHLRAGAEKRIPKLEIYNYLTEFVLNMEKARRSEGMEYDILHSHYWLSGWVGQRMQERWKIPHIIRFHTLGTIKNSTGIGEKEPLLRIQREEELVKTCQRMIVSTNRERDDLICCCGAPPMRIRIIPCGVNLGLFQPIDKERARRRLNLNGEDVILFVGRIVPIKGLDSLLMAMSNLDGQKPVKLLVVGGDEQSSTPMENLKRLVRELRISERVTFFGFVDHEELPWFYSAADVCVMPSFHESFGLVALESLACGTPVVATNVGAMESVIQSGHTGYVVPNNSPVHLAEKIAQFLQRGTGSRKPVETIRASVLRFSWSRVAEAIEHEYASVIKSYFAERTGLFGIEEMGRSLCYDLEQVPRSAGAFDE